MSEAKEGKLLGRKKLLDPHLGTTEGTKITSTIIFYTSHALTVYSSGHLARNTCCCALENQEDQCEKFLLESIHMKLYRSSVKIRETWQQTVCLVR